MFKRRLILAAGVLGCLLLAGCELFQQPPVASFVVNYDVDPTDPMVVELDASASSDANGDAITAYKWVFGDDVTIITPLSYSQTVAVPKLLVKYPVEDTYSAQLVVVNEIGEQSAPTFGTITLPHE
ncbi:MAG: PKD domain-containing protein [Candidatus Bipolaricaulis sp.]|nr:PKD domain-containing protein [Candidatus Bipolaricaulis sp.]